jgi:hypothetical protein
MPEIAEDGGEQKPTRCSDLVKRSRVWYVASRWWVNFTTLKHIPEVKIPPPFLPLPLSAISMW